MTAPPARQQRQGGWASILLLVFIVSVVLVVLMQSLRVSSNQAWATGAQHESTAALALADSGLELALARLSEQIYADEQTWASACANVVESSASPLGDGTVQVLSSPTNTTGPTLSTVPIAAAPLSTASTGVYAPVQADTTGLCPLRAQGGLGQAQRTLESWTDYALWAGATGASTTPTLRVRNPYTTPALTLTNLAWLSGSTASPCTTGCSQLWNFESTHKASAVGSMGVAIASTAQHTQSTSHSLSVAQDFAETGVTLGGTATTPSLVGVYANDADTASDKVFTGATSSGQGAGWCVGADTLVFGVSGRNNGTLSASFTSVRFNSAAKTLAQPIELTRIAHYPYTDGSSSGGTGQLFSETWAITNPYGFMTASSSSGSTISVDNTTGLTPGTLIKIYTPVKNGGALAPYTTITAVTASSVTVSPAPTSAFIGGETICAGICALFDAPSNTNTNKTSTEFVLTPSGASITEWAGGFSCLSGVDPTRIRPVAVPVITPRQWHDVRDGE